MYPCTQVLVKKYWLEAFKSHLKQFFFSDLNDFSHNGGFEWPDISQKSYFATWY